LSAVPDRYVPPLIFGDHLNSASGLLRSDDEGRFSGTLIRDGLWRIEVKTQAPPLSLEMEQTVEARGGRATMEIEVSGPVE
jgi:hypothetical protein